MAGRRKVSISMDRNDRSKCLPSAPVTDSAIVSEIISRLEVKYSQLSLKHEVLSAKYEKVLAFAHEAVWEYNVSSSKDFGHIPVCKNRSADIDSSVGEYAIEKCLRKGNYAIVNSCVRKDTKFVVKTISKDIICSIEHAIMVNTEIKALMVLSGHMHVVGFEDVIHTPNHIHIVTEWFPCDLFEFLSEHHTVMNEKIVSVIIRKLLLGVEHMHTHNIVHRDLKPENVLIAFNYKNEIFVKICDFGLAYFLPPVSDAHSSIMGTTVNSTVSGVTGSAGFFAPECVLSVNEYCGVKADLFSVGCICLEMLSTGTFFQEEWMRSYESAVLPTSPDCHQFERALSRVILRAHTETNHRHPLSVAEFIAGSLNFHPQSRFSMQDMLYCRWLCVAERLEKPVNLGAHFDFSVKDAAGQVSKTYIPTEHQDLSLRTSPQQSRQLTGNALQHANEKDLHARIAANMRHFEALTAGTTGSGGNSISGNNSSSTSPPITTFMKRTHQVPIPNMPGGGSGVVGGCGFGGETKCEVAAAGHHPVPYASTVPVQHPPTASRPVETGESPLMTIALKRVMLPGTHITLNPLSATAVLSPLSSPTKQIVTTSSPSDVVSPLSIAQAVYASPGHGHSQSKKFASLPTHSSTADRQVDKPSSSPLRSFTSSGALASALVARSKQQTVVQNAGAALANYSDQYSGVSSCDYLNDQQRKAVRAELASTQAFEAIQARMLSGDYSLLEETSVVPGSTPRRDVTSPRGHASASGHRIATRGASGTGTTVQKLSLRGVSSSNVHTASGSGSGYNTKHSGSATGSRGASLVSSSGAVHIKTTTINHSAPSPLRFG